jgi:hypothetical protein
MDCAFVVRPSLEVDVKVGSPSYFFRRIGGDENRGKAPSTRQHDIIYGVSSPAQVFSRTFFT